jgi:hypothetical protein
MLIPLALVFSVAMLWKGYHEHSVDGATLEMARNAEFLSAVLLLLFRHVVRRFDRIDTPTRRIHAHAIHDLHDAGSVAGGPGKNPRGLVQHSASIVSDCLAACTDRVRLALPLTARPYLLVLLAYVVIEAFRIILGRPV